MIFRKIKGREKGTKKGRGKRKKGDKHIRKKEGREAERGKERSEIAGGKEGRGIPRERGKAVRSEPPLSFPKQFTCLQHYPLLRRIQNEEQPSAEHVRWVGGA